MRAIVNTKQLKIALTKLSPLNLPSTLSILQHVHVSVAKDLLTLTGTNLENTVSISIPARDTEPGETLLPYKKLKSVVHHLKINYLTLKQKEKFTISFDGASVSIPSMTTEDFPEIKEVSGESFITNVAIKDLNQAFSCVLPMVATDAARPTLEYVQVKKDGNTLHLRATNSFVGAEKTFEISDVFSNNTGESELLLWRETLNLMSKVIKTGSVDIFVSKENVFIVGRDETITTPLADYQYPDFSEIMQVDVKTTVTFDKEDVLRVMPIFKGYNKGVFVSVEKKDVLKISAGDDEATIECCTEGVDTKINVNPVYFVDAVSVFEKEVALKIDNAKFPIMFYGSDLSVVLMPMYKPGDE